MKWIALIEREVKGSQGLAVDELITSIYKEFGDFFIHIYTFSPPCAVLGYHQDAGVINKKRCNELGVQITRRLTGGGCVLMSETTVGIGIGGKEINATPFRVCEEMSRFIVEGLRTFSLDSVLTPRNDIQVGGRKIAGVGVYRNGEGDMLFHCSLLIDFDFDMMLEVLNGEELKRSEREARNRITTLTIETGRLWELEEIADRLLFAIKKVYRAHVERISRDVLPIDKVEELAVSKYENPKWIEGELVDEIKEAFRFRTESGVIKLVIMRDSERRVEDLKVYSDVFFSPCEIRSRLKELLCGKRVSCDEIKRAVEVSTGEKVVEVKSGEVGACFFRVQSMSE